MIAVDFSRQKELETDLIANQRIEVVGHLINDGDADNPDYDPPNNDYSKFVLTILNVPCFKGERVYYCSVKHILKTLENLF